MLTLHLKHTSASLLIQENADPDVRRDLDAFFARLVRDGDPLFIHTAEGDDDMAAHIRDSRGKSLGDLLAEFAKLRAENLETLKGFRLSDAQLKLTGEHPEFGSVTLSQLLATWVAHDLGHIAQIARVMAKQYREAVGPWRQYLPVLDR